MEKVNEIRAIAVKGLAKTHRTVELFGDGFLSGAKSGWNVMLSTYSGVMNGLKYKGSLKVGLQAGGTVYLVLCVMDGIMYVVQNWDEVKRI